MTPTRSLLHRLPDIIALARQRARDLPGPAGRPGLSFDRLDPPGHADQQRVSLLCGDDLSAMLGLLAGLGREGSLAGRIPLVWLNENPHESTDTEGTPLTPVQRETCRMIELATRLFLVRDLLGAQGVLALTARDAPDRNMERLLETVFGHSRREHVRPSTGWRTFLAGGPASLAADLDDRKEGLPSGPLLLGELAQRITATGDPVLVLRADVPSTEWVAALDRRWIFVNDEAMSLALLREHVIARQMAAGAHLHAEEQGYGWAAES